MTQKSKILVVDDTPLNVKVLVNLLTHKGYDVVSASGGVEGLEKVRLERPDLILLDVMMPDLNGYDVCRTIRADKDPQTSSLPIIMITALDPNSERTVGLDAGADDFLPKPINQAELIARVKSLIRLKSYHDTIIDQSNKLLWMNQTLEKRVKTQVDEIEKLRKLKEFFSPQIIQAILNQGEEILKIHRRNIVVIFLDLRGFTAFTDNAEPEEVVSLLSNYHRTMGELITKHEATLGYYSGDGIMVYFNDPIPIPNPIEAAIKLCIEMQEKFKPLEISLQKQGFELSLGIGFAQGYATLGVVGFEGHWAYTCIGSVCNMASRLCGEARGGEILTAQKTFLQVENSVQSENMGTFSLKGFSKPIPIYKILSMK